MLELTDQVGRRLRRHGILGKTVQIKVRFAGFHTITRAKTLPAPSHTTQLLWETAKDLLATVRTEDRRSVRLLGMGVSNLTCNEKKQQSLFDQEEQIKANRMDVAADEIRDKFGGAAVKRGSSLEHQVKYRSDPRVNE